MCRPNRRIIIGRLLTSIESGEAEVVCEIVRLYYLRCSIERMLRALKNNDMRLAGTQMHDGGRTV
jgi:hypothetical protein